MGVAKTKMLFSSTVTAKLIWVFVNAYANCWFSHAVAQILIGSKSHCRAVLQCPICRAGNLFVIIIMNFFFFSIITCHIFLAW